MPLHIACGNGHVDAARLLLDKGAEVDRANQNGTPLYVACQNDTSTRHGVVGQRRGRRPVQKWGDAPILSLPERPRRRGPRCWTTAEVDRAEEDGRRRVCRLLGQLARRGCCWTTARGRSRTNWVRRRCPSQKPATPAVAAPSRSPDHYHWCRASYGSSRTSSALSASGRASNARGRSAITASAASASRKCVGRTHRRIVPRVRFAGSPCFWASSRDDQAWQAAP